LLQRLGKAGQFLIARDDTLRSKQLLRKCLFPVQGRKQDKGVLSFFGSTIIALQMDIIIHANKKTSRFVTIVLFEGKYKLLDAANNF